jgi:hypothetical protein
LCPSSLLLLLLISAVPLPIKINALAFFLFFEEKSVLSAAFIVTLLFLSACIDVPVCIEETQKLQLKVNIVFQ